VSGRYASPKTTTPRFQFFPAHWGPWLLFLSSKNSFLLFCPFQIQEKHLGNKVVLDVKKKKTLQANTSGNLSWKHICSRQIFPVGIERLEFAYHVSVCPTSVPSHLKSMAARLFCILTRFCWWLTPYFSWSAR